MPYFSILLVSVSAAFFYAGAVIEQKHPLIWCAPSLLISALMMFVLHWGFVEILLGQAGLFAAITLFRVTRKS